MRADAYAKVNLGLHLRRRGADGYHPLVALNQSVGWSDRLELEAAPSDEFVLEGPGPDDDTNLAWQAVESVRTSGPEPTPVRLRLEKKIPIAAGLAGGSADAACALALGAELMGAPPGGLAEAAFDLGADVPFCLAGGLALVEGRGERVRSLDPVADFALALVVPPFEVDTAACFTAWDELDGPEGAPFEQVALPPGLRQHGPLANDLYPAALHLQPGLDDWRSDLAALWARPVAMSGSGPSLFAYFLDLDEARSALEHVPLGARATNAVEPTTKGWQHVPGTLAAGG